MNVMNAGIPIIIQMANGPQMGFLHPKNKDPQIHCFMIILVEIAISFWGLHGFAAFSDRSKWAKAVWEFANSVGECSGEAKDDELSHPTSRPRAAPLDFPHKAWTAACGLRKEFFGPLLMCSLPEDRESCNTGGVVTIIVRYCQYILILKPWASTFLRWYDDRLWHPSIKPLQLMVHFIGPPRQTTSKWWDCLGTL